jgi:nucleotide-binding universal stress UspA family protein
VILDEKPPEAPDIRRVVVAADLDDPSDAALAWGAQLSKQLGCALVLLVPDEVDSAEKVPGEQVDEVRRTGADADEWAGRLGVDVDGIEVVIGDQDRALVSGTDEHDVAVVGTARIVGSTRLALGAEAHGLARHLRCPLIAVPAGAGSERSGPIVVGLGGHEAEPAALAFATALGRSLGRRVVAVHAVDPMYATFDNAGRVGDDERVARRTAQEWDVELRESYGGPADVLRELGDELAASLVVVATKHRHTLGGRLVGKVADEVLHEPHGPIAIVTHRYETSDDETVTRSAGA